MSHWYYSGLTCFLLLSAISVAPIFCKSPEQLASAAFSCNSAKDLRLNRGTYGVPLEREAKGLMVVYDAKRKKTNRYRENEVYTIYYETSSHFRGFILQAVATTENGISSYRVGKFIEDSNWDQYGIKFQDCAGLMNDSLTHSNPDQKYIIKVRWSTASNEGPVQLVFTVFREFDFYYERWQPKTGFLLPDGFDGAQNTQKPVTDKPKTQPPIQTTRQTQKTTPRRMTTRISRPVFTERPDTTPRPTTERQSSLRTTSRPKTTRTSRPFTQTVRLTTPIPTTESSLRTTPRKPTTTSTPRASTQRVPFTTTSPATEQQSSLRTAPRKPTTTSTPRPSTQRAPFITTSPATEKQSSLRTTPRRRPTTRTARPFTQRPMVTTPMPTRGRPSRLRTTSRRRITTRTARPFTRRPGITTPRPTRRRTSRFRTTSRRRTTTRRPRPFTQRPRVTTPRPTRGRPSRFRTTPTRRTTTRAPRPVSPRVRFTTPAPINGSQTIVERLGTTEKPVVRCSQNPCYNDARCVQRRDKVRCVCRAGYMGPTCKRPCQDVYLSCEVWIRKKPCDFMRKQTPFFDDNCAASCNQCRFSEATVGNQTYPPLAPVLEPFDFLLGIWETRGGASLNFPLRVHSKNAYKHQLRFEPNSVPVFGTPALNYSSTAVNTKDPNDVQIIRGYLSIRNKPTEGHPIVALMTAGNTGLLLHEEGYVDLTQQTMTLELLNIAAHPALTRRVSKLKPRSVTRVFKRSGNRIDVQVFMKDSRNRTSSYINRYSKLYSIS